MGKAADSWGGAASCLDTVPDQLCDSGKATFLKFPVLRHRPLDKTSASLEGVRIRWENVFELRWKPSAGVM